MVSSKRLALIGKGPWGQNYLRTLTAFPVEVAVGGRESWASLLDERPDGAIICTPPATHVELATYALERGIPVMIEKPLSLSLAEAGSLARYDTPILVNHVYLFSERYQQFRSEVVGKPFVRVESIGLGTKAHEGYSALWDYGPHDLSILLDLFERAPERASATTRDGREFQIELDFGGVHTRSRIGIGPSRERKVTVSYEGGTASFADTGDETPSPLHSAVATFLAALDGVHDRRLGLSLPLDVMRVLDACQRSLETARPVALP